VVIYHRNANGLYLHSNKGRRSGLLTEPSGEGATST
jgi:hypothetical protein